MCGNWISPHNRHFLGGPVGQTVVSLAAAPLLGPEIGALTGGLAGLTPAATGAILAGAGTGGLTGMGGGLKGSLEGAALGGAGGFFSGGGFGQAFPQTSASLSNGLTNLYNSTGLSSLGDGISNMLGFGGTPTTDAATNAARDAVSTASTAAPSTGTLTGYLPGTGGSIAGGGVSGGFVTAPGSTGTFGYDLSGNAVAPVDAGIGAGVGATQAGPIGSLFTPDYTPSTGGYNYDLNGNAAGLSSYAAPDMVSAAAPAAGLNPTLGSTPSVAKGLGSMISPLENTAMKTGLSYLLGKINQGGYNALRDAENQYAANYQPFLQSGQNANNTLANLYGLNGADAAKAATQNWQNTPGYQFQLQQGLNALDASAAARGMLMSGQQQRAVQDYGTNLANQYYQNYLANLQNQADQGRQAAAGVGSGQLGAAQVYSHNKANQANNYNAVLGGLANWMFPSGGLNATPNGAGGYDFLATDPNSGILSYLFS
jgi:hypothetical protein